MGFYAHHEHEGETQDSACTHEDGTGRVCGASWDSALHPPDQYRHWCSALEAGGDCIHEEAQHETI